MRVPVILGTTFARAGVALLAVSLIGTSVADAAPKKKKEARNKAAVTRTVADSGVWKRGYSDIVIDANTGKVLHEENPDALRHPASVTKVMTLYLLFEQLEARRMTLNTQLRVSAYAAAQQPSKLGVKAGSTISVEDAIQAIVTRSANDVAVVIAENIAGDSASFARLMTQRARSLGMSRSTFKNPNGLPDPQQVTTARDLATLGRAIQERFPRYYAYFSTRSFVYRGTTIPSHNRMFGRIEGVDGIKTGYTAASGFNLLTSVKHDGHYVIAVVMGGTSAASRDNRMVALLNDTLPQSYAGRQMVARMNSAPALSSEDEAPVERAAVVAVARQAAPEPEAEPEAEAEAEAAPAPTPAPPPAAAAARAPVTIPVPTASPRLAMASVAGTDSMTTASIPAPAPVARQSAKSQAATSQAPTSQAATQVGSAQPIVPVAVKTVPVARPAAPTASFSNQPGILGTLSFTSVDGSNPVGATAAPVASAPAQRAIKPVQLASAGPTQIPQQEAEPAETAAARPRSGGWGIQIGAFGSEADARDQMAKAKQKAPGPLASADPYTEQVAKGSSRIVRARFVGFSAESAAQKACQALKRSDFSCMVFRN